MAVSGLGLATVAVSGPNTASSAAAPGPDCAEPVCDDKKDMFNAMMGGKNQNAHKNRECPLTRSQLGRSTWEFLHTTAAYYPEKPTEEQQKAARDLVDSMSVLYACSHCREHFRNHVEEHPVDVSSRKAFATWLCETHNVVNEVLGKPQFDCAKLEERWRTGCRETAKAKAK